MADLQRGVIPESTILPEKVFLDESDLLEVWELRGMKFRFDDFYTFLCERGLLPHLRRDSFRKKVYGILRKFLSEGETRVDPRTAPRMKPLKMR